MINGKALRERREAAGLSIRGLAGEVGIAHQLIMRAERGEKQLSLAVTAAIAKRLGCTVDDLLMHDD